MQVFPGINVLSRPRWPGHRLGLLAVFGMCSVSEWGTAQTAPDAYRKITDIPYAQVGDHPLLLDLYLPKKVDRAPLVVWVHGGAWRHGSKESMPLKWLVLRGYVVASVDYRLSPVAKFPAQIHDCKAAIRFLRGQQQYDYNAERIVVAGASAGGHLAALIGLTNRHVELEGSLGDHRKPVIDG